MTDRSNAELVEAFASFNAFAAMLREKLDDRRWHTPIAEGKWTAKDIVCHIMLWDKYFYEEAIAKAVRREPLTVRHLDYDTFNAGAVDYARTQTVGAIVEQLTAWRTNIVRGIAALPEEAYAEAHTDGDGHPFTIRQYLIDFVGHDRHHQGQLESFVRAEAAGANG